MCNKEFRNKLYYLIEVDKVPENPYKIICESLLKIRPSEFDQMSPAEQISIQGQSAGFESGQQSILKDAKLVDLDKTIEEWLYEKLESYSKMPEVDFSDYLEGEKK